MMSEAINIQTINQISELEVKLSIYETIFGRQVTESFQWYKNVRRLNLPIINLWVNNHNAFKFNLSKELTGLEVACWPLVPKFAGSNPTEAVGYFRAKKKILSLPSEGK